MAFWVPLMMAAAGAYMGHKKNERDREIEDADTKLQSELTRYSWVDGAMKGNPGAIRRAGSQIGDIGQGALSGAMFGSQFGNWGSKTPPSTGSEGSGMLGVNTASVAEPTVNFSRYGVYDPAFPNDNSNFYLNQLRSSRLAGR